MDGTRFDAITQSLTESATRRRILGGVLGGATLLTGAALTRTGDADAKKGKGKAKGKGKGKGKGKTKVTICHKGQLLTVAQPALKGHLKHGDTRCEVGVCQVGDPTGCDAEGACTFALAEVGAECELEGVIGTCDATGACLPVPPV